AGVTLCDAPVWFTPDPISYGIPDNWGAAAVVYALVEGLAGVKDLGTAYSHALLAPRWAAAGVDEAEATVVYPASDGYLAYRYARHDDGLSLTVTGSGERIECRVLLPSAAAIGQVWVDGQPAPFTVAGEGEARYLSFELGGGVHRVTAR
ncbi:MAG: hypothetical protein HZB16_23230, partial [Armatimonadetes bacterium]|nr:hypothetical protein [Armatimonadota bacterium]